MRVASLYNRSVESRLQRSIRLALEECLPHLDHLPFDQTTLTNQTPIDCRGYDVVISQQGEITTLVQSDAQTIRILYEPGQDSARGDADACSTPADDVDDLPSIPLPIAYARMNSNGWHRVVGNVSQFSLPADRESDVIPPPADTEFFAPHATKREGFYLLIRDQLHDALITQVDLACQQLERRLVIVDCRPDSPWTAELGERTQLISNPPQEQMRELYRTCRAVISPAETSFDLSLVEAQSCGAAVIGFRHSGAAQCIVDAEVSGLGTGILFDEPTAENIASAIVELEKRPNRLSPGLAWANAARFSTDRFQHSFQELSERLLALASLIEPMNTSEGQRVPKRFAA